MTPTVEPPTRTELEAAAFRTLVAHLRERTDVQNIDLMNLAGFCRNCLAKWYRAAAEERGQAMTYDEARELVYGMPYDEWRRPLPDRGVRSGQGWLRALARLTLLPQNAQYVRILTFFAGDRVRQGDIVRGGGLIGRKPSLEYLRPRPAVLTPSQASSWKTGGPRAARFALWCVPADSDLDRTSVMR